MKFHVNIRPWVIGTEAVKVGGMSIEAENIAEALKILSERLAEPERNDIAITIERTSE